MSCEIVQNITTCNYPHKQCIQSIVQDSSGIGEQLGKATTCNSV